MERRDVDVVPSQLRKRPEKKKGNSIIFYYFQLFIYIVLDKRDVKSFQDENVSQNNAYKAKKSCLMSLLFSMKAKFGLNYL